MQVTDQIHRTIDIPEDPRRIISLVPSITELLFDLDLEEHLKGRTRFCIHPKEKVNKVPVLGGVMGLNFHKIEKIEPDLVLASKEENAKGEIMELSNQFPVWVSDVHNLHDAFSMIYTIGWICNRNEKALALTKKIEEAFNTLNHIPENVVKAAYLIWKNPFYTVNRETFVHDMLKRSGIENVFADKKEPYPIVSEKDIRQRKADYIFLPSEPYNFKENDVKAFKQSFPKMQIKRVEGEYFTWYGSRLLNAPYYFKQLF
ncbi:MAG: helical backbone metal receptor [Bacteroidales bacterium]|nr:ABC transporter substrate-binding protein [Bacteroidales bacterium]MBS3776010.1 ABC transporter substrate-binding protein [Bacteroidales bacterium]